MNVDVHIPDESLEKLAALVAAKLVELNVDRLGAFLNEEPQEAETKQVEKEIAPGATRADLTKALVALAKTKGKKEVVKLLNSFGADSAKEVGDDQLGAVVAAATSAAQGGE